MNVNFNLDEITATEFGVGRDRTGQPTFTLMSVNGQAQQALLEMVRVTIASLEQNEADSAEYNPAEKYASREYLYLPIDDAMAEIYRNLHEANDMVLDNNARNNMSNVFCYFVRFRDGGGKRLTALHRAGQFKSLGRSRLLSWLDDSLGVVGDSIFKLDIDFDVLVDSEQVNILRPSSFEYSGQLQEAILQAVPHNIAIIQTDLPFVDWTTVEDYAGNHPRAARYLASIRSQGWTENIDQNALAEWCAATDVDIQILNGQVTIAEGHIMGFLEVLDRRRLQSRLIPDSPEYFRASSRERIQPQG